MATDLRKMKAARSAKRPAKVFLMIMGDAGTGKTRLGAIMSKCPIVALFERQGEITVEQENPDATIWMLYEDDDEGTYTGTPFGAITSPALRLKKLDHMMDAIWVSEPAESGEGRLVPSPVLDGELNVVGWDWDAAVLADGFVLDTLTEFQKATFNLMIGRESYDPAVLDFKDKGLGNAYQNLNRRTEVLCEQLRDMPIDTVALGHVSDKEVRGGLKAMLALSGDKVAPDLPRLATACGWIMSREVDGRIARFCVFQGASDVAILKWCRGLEATESLPEDPDENGPADWIRRIKEAGPGEAGGLKEARLDTAAALGQAAKVGADAAELAKRRKERADAWKKRKGGGWSDGPGAGGGEPPDQAAGGEAPARGRVRRSDLKSE